MADIKNLVEEYNNWAGDARETLVLDEKTGSVTTQSGATVSEEAITKSINHNSEKYNEVIAQFYDEHSEDTSRADFTQLCDKIETVLTNPNTRLSDYKELAVEVAAATHEDKTVRIDFDTMQKLDTVLESKTKRAAEGSVESKLSEALKENDFVMRTEVDESGKHTDIYEGKDVTITVHEAEDDTSEGDVFVTTKENDEDVSYKLDNDNLVKQDTPDIYIETDKEPAQQVINNLDIWTISDDGTVKDAVGDGVDIEPFVTMDENALVVQLDDDEKASSDTLKDVSIDTGGKNQKHYRDKTEQVSGDKTDTKTDKTVNNEIDKVRFAGVSHIDWNSDRIQGGTKLGDITSRLEAILVRTGHIDAADQTYVTARNNAKDNKEKATIYRGDFLNEYATNLINSSRQIGKEVDHYNTLLAKTDVLADRYDELKLEARGDRIYNSSGDEISVEKVRFCSGGADTSLADTAFESYKGVLEEKNIDISQLDELVCAIDSESSGFISLVGEQMSDKEAVVEWVGSIIYSECSSEDEYNKLMEEIAEKVNGADATFKEDAEKRGSLSSNDLQELTAAVQDYNAAYTDVFKFNELVDQLGERENKHNFGDMRVEYKKLQVMEICREYGIPYRGHIVKSTELLYQRVLVAACCINFSNTVINMVLDKVEEKFMETQANYKERVEVGNKTFAEREKVDTDGKLSDTAKAFISSEHIDFKDTSITVTNKGLDVKYEIYDKEHNLVATINTTTDAVTKAETCKDYTIYKSDVLPREDIAQLVSNDVNLTSDNIEKNVSDEGVTYSIKVDDKNADLERYTDDNGSEHIKVTEHDVDTSDIKNNTTLGEVAIPAQMEKVTDISDGSAVVTYEGYINDQPLISIELHKEDNGAEKVKVTEYGVDMSNIESALQDRKVDVDNIDVASSIKTTEDGQVTYELKNDDNETIALVSCSKDDSGADKVEAVDRRVPSNSDILSCSALLGVDVSVLAGQDKEGSIQQAKDKTIVYDDKGVISKISTDYREVGVTRNVSLPDVKAIGQALEKTGSAKGVDINQSNLIKVGTGDKAIFTDSNHKFMAIFSIESSSPTLERFIFTTDEGNSAELVPTENKVDMNVNEGMVVGIHLGAEALKNKIGVIEDYLSAQVASKDVTSVSDSVTDITYNAPDLISSAIDIFLEHHGDLSDEEKSTLVSAVDTLCDSSAVAAPYDQLVEAGMYDQVLEAAVPALYEKIAAFITSVADMTEDRAAEPTEVKQSDLLERCDKLLGIENTPKPTLNDIEVVKAVVQNSDKIADFKGVDNVEALIQRIIAVTDDKHFKERHTAVGEGEQVFFAKDIEIKIDTETGDIKEIEIDGEHYAADDVSANDQEQQMEDVEALNETDVFEDDISADTIEESDNDE